MTKSAPLFLAATPQLEDPHFSRSVVLLLEHNTKGAAGLIINQPLNVSLADFARNQEFVCHPLLASQPVFRGGPVDPKKGWLLHTEIQVSEKEELMPNLYLSRTTPTLKELLKQGKEPVRLLLGYSGWEKGQLEKEMSEGSWIAAQVNLGHLLHLDPNEIWNAVLRYLGIDPYRLVSGRGIH